LFSFYTAKIHVDDGLGLTVHKTFDGRPNFLGDLTGRPDVNDSGTTDRYSGVHIAVNMTFV